MSKSPVNQTITGIAPSGIRKFFDIVAEMKDAISLGVGEPDFDTPWRVRDEAIYSLEQGRTFYTSNAGLFELKEAICGYLDRKYKLSYDPKTEVMVTVGGSEAIDLAFRAMLDPGDEVLIPQPSYVSYVPCATLAGGVPVTIDLKEENEFRLTAQELEEHITDKTKILVLPFPNNPTGAIMEMEDLVAIADVIARHDIYVLTDEIYSELTYGTEHVSIASLPGMKERTVYINGFSKAFAMTGWRLGYVCAPEEILEQMLKIHQFAIMCAPTTSQYAGVEAVKHCDKEVAAMREEYDGRRRYLLERLRGMGLSCFEPFGAFYMFPSIKEFGMTSDEFATRLLEAKKVAIVPGTAFGACGEGFLRISYAYSIESLKTALDRMEEFVTELRNQKQ
ncbi:MAG: aminotransferase class I/II-fold pyridoxal phosphate-dependent enzyme [Candidatus Weimeria sp.]|nr:aminotransferase class I/II-fold pyridoxal phosphate-dependent enzyme [Lachnospiraceae bacterium]MEE3356138.1 aminotransferase class I/II-fold pyridoxal phosphate-dependent enzyme [Candidatus Weimeria sp.]